MSLTRGQVAWAVCWGRTPEQPVLDQLRYLKQLGIPFEDGAQGKGRGNRLTYTFYDLMDAAVAMEALRWGIPARLLKHLVERRPAIRKAYLKCFKNIPEAAYADLAALKPTTQTTVFENDVYIFFQGRFSSSPGDTDIVDTTNLSPTAAEVALNHFMHGPDVTAISLRRLIVPMMLLAAKAPYIPTGPKT
jgi:hypothetical protein